MLLRDMPTVAAIAANAGATIDLVNLIITSKSAMFTRMEIKKRGGRGIRVIFQVHETAKALHRKIALWVQDSWAPPEYVHGFRKKRSIVHHARTHVGQQLVVTADILDFFPSITARQVYDTFIYLGATPEVSSLLTDLCTIDGVLPAGTRCSPIIANVACRELDEDLISRYPRYGRYADDLAFSGAAEASVPTEDDLRNLLSKHGFNLRDGSYFRIPRNRIQYVTGLIVNDPMGPHIGGETKRALRQEVFYIRKLGLEAHCTRIGADPVSRYRYLCGKLHQVAMVEHDFAQSLLEQLPELVFSEPDLSMIESDDDLWD